MSGLSLVQLAISFAVSFGATWIMIQVAIPDVPDHRRKQHRVPNPTAGGIGIFAGILAGIAAPLIFGETFGPANPTITLPQQTMMLSVPLAGALLGFIDDKRDLSAKLKLVVMVIFAALIAAQYRVSSLDISAQLPVTLPVAIGFLGAMLWVLVVTNAVNFLDGSNGMSMGCAACSFIGLGLLSVSDQSWAGGSQLAAIAAAALVGFLLWNAPKGAIFSGDTGALGIGLLLATFGLSVAADQDRPVWAVALCLLPMLSDVILTVGWRLAKRHNVTTAHRHHVYQVLLRAGFTHLQVAVLYWGLTAICCSIAVIVAHPNSDFPADDRTFASFITFCISLLSLCALYIVVRRLARVRHLNDM